MIQRIIIALLFVISTSVFAQEEIINPKPAHDGDFYFYWGWNWGWYGKSDISFNGPNYDFTLDKVAAKDRQSPFDAGIYFNPKWLTIPQYNFRLGYFFNDNYNFSIGIDHMKYVMQANQTVKISGNIDGTGTDYDKSYNNDDIVLEQDFLQFEHTDGLNYANIEFRRFDEIFDLDKVKINLTEGLGAGVLIPKTNTKLLNIERYDEFHLAGYGLSGVVGLNINLYRYFFIQTEFKGGFINMPDIRTTASVEDKASQHFFFTQLNVVFGATLNLKKNKSKLEIK